jgi:hypothetical protein
VLAALAVLVVTIGLAILFVNAIRGPTFGDGPRVAPYSADAIADCLRSLRGHTEGELTSGSHFVDGPSPLEAEAPGVNPVPSEYIRVDFIIEVLDDELRQTKVQLFVVETEEEAARIFAARLRGSASGYGGDGIVATARASRHLYRLGNVVAHWDAGHTPEHDARVLSCLE